jgi:hypothetical protein
VLKKEKKLRKIIQFFKLIAKHWAAMVGKPLVPPKTNQSLWLMVNPCSTKSFGYSKTYKKRMPIAL